jgi:uncharacterized membrane protein
MNATISRFLVSLQAPVWCPWCGSHMSGWGWFIMMFTSLILLVLVIVAAWALIQRGGFGGLTQTQGDSAEGILRQRYARRDRRGNLPPDA